MELVEERMAQNPVDQFERWLRNAEEVGEFQPRAMALATVGEDGRPSVRFIMLRQIDSHGLVFYTNYNSRKARELAKSQWCGPEPLVGFESATRQIVRGRVH